MVNISDLCKWCENALIPLAPYHSFIYLFFLSFSFQFISIDPMELILMNGVRTELNLNIFPLKFSHIVQESSALYPFFLNSL